MSKTILLSYKAQQFQALNSDSFMYTLKVKVFLLFGLIKYEKEIPYEARCDLTKLTNHWDELIKNKKPLE